jgi:hypothetical protein
MGWFWRKKDDTGNEDESVPDYIVPDVDSSSQQLIVPIIQKASCSKRFRAEINPCQSWFHVKDPINGRVLDIPESFAPGSCTVFFWKVLYSGACIGTLVWAMIDSTPYFYFAYLTSWGVLWCCLYSLMSVLNTVMAARTPQPAADRSVGLRIRLTWILFSLASHTSSVATLLYWPLVFDPSTTDVTYLHMAPHGILFLLTCFDGFYVNRIPLRWMFWYGFLLPFDILYIIWSVIHDLLDLGNPDYSDNDPTTNDDALYVGVLEWNYDWQKALIWSIVTVFVVGPIMYGILWTISTGCCCKDTRKYIDSVDPTDDRPTVDDVEEGSIFAKWK